MKIALLQLNVRTGDLKANSEKIIQVCRKAQWQGAELCFAPMAALTGPDPGFLWESSSFREDCRASLRHIADLLKDTMNLAILGNENFESHCFGKGLQESWPDELPFLPIEPFSPGWGKNQERLLRKLCGENDKPGLFVNLVGGYGSNVYAGQSMVMNSKGTILAKAKAFNEDLLLLEYNGEDGNPPLSRIEKSPDLDESQWQALVLGTRDFVHKSGASDVLIGLSGGMDSAFVACVAVEALGRDHVRVVLMPSPYTSPESVEDATRLAKNLEIQHLTLPIIALMKTCDQTLEAAFSELPERHGDLVSENLQARLRAVLLMALANRTGALVLNTGNLSEAAMGYSTLYGDSIGALAVIGDLFKTRVYELARWYCKTHPERQIPENIFIKAPSAELRPDQKDSDSLPPYEILDPILESLAKGNLIRTTDSLRESVRKKVCAMQFKREQTPPPLRVGIPLPRWPLAAVFD